MTLNYLLQMGRPRKGQLNIIDIFNIPDLLLQRGFEDVSENVIEETLMNSDANPIFKRDKNNIPDWSVLKEFINEFTNKSFRLQLKNMVLGTGQSISSGKYIFEATANNIKRYSNTLELLIAYLCVKELQALSASFGVKIKGAPDGGDFDCLANFQNSLFYFEIKSGDIRNIEENVLQSFLNRHTFLAPHASILFIDYQSGKKDEVDKLALKFCDLKIGARRKIQSINKVQDGSNKFFTLASDLMVVDLHTNKDILSNLRSAMQYFHRFNAHSNTMWYDIITPENLGYESSKLNKIE